MKNIKKSFAFISVLLMSSTLFANTDYTSYKENNQNLHQEYKKINGYNNHDKKKSRYHRGDIGRFFIGVVYNLDLTKKQNEEIDAIIRDFKNKRFDKFNGFTEDGFDKQAYINARMKSKSDKIKLKADLIENIYKVLDKKQIEKLNKKIKLFKQRKMNKRKKMNKDNNGSNCNDRR